jgi:hypothetical protein
MSFTNKWVSLAMSADADTVNFGPFLVQSSSISFIIFLDFAFISLFNTQTMPYHLAKKPYTLVGFEPGLFDPEAVAMPISTAPVGIHYLLSIS